MSKITNERITITLSPLILAKLQTWATLRGTTRAALAGDLVTEGVQSALPAIATLIQEEATRLGIDPSQIEASAKNPSKTTF